MRSIGLFIGVVVFLLSAGTSGAQTPEQAVEPVVREVVAAYVRQDAAVLQRHIDPAFGLAFVFRRGAHDNVAVASGIDFQAPVPEYLPYATDLVIAPRLIKGRHPEFDCGSEKWSQAPGIYVDQAAPELLRLAQAQQALGGDGWDAPTLQRFAYVDKASRKITVISSNDKELIFYLTWLNGRWALTAIDRFEACSA